MCERVPCVDIESFVTVEQLSEWRPACVSAVVVYVIRQRSVDFNQYICLVRAVVRNHQCVFIGAVCRVVDFVVFLNYFFVLSFRFFFSCLHTEIVLHSGGFGVCSRPPHTVSRCDRACDTCATQCLIRQRKCKRIKIKPNDKTSRINRE